MLEDIALLPKGSSTFRTQQNQILEELTASLTDGDSTLFDDYLIVTPQGEILVSSNSNWNLEQVSEQTFFIEEVRTSEVSSYIVFSPLPFNQGSDLSGYDVVLFSSQPVLTNQGSLIGYVFGLSASPSIQHILEKNSGFLPNNNLFLVNDKGGFAGITDLAVENSLSLYTPNAAQEDLVYAGLSENPEAVEYASSDGRNVYGLYTFYPRLNIGFVVEYPIQIDLNRHSQGNALTLLIIGGFSLLIGLFLFFGAQRITKPLGELSKTVLQFSEGNWETRAQVNPRR